MSQVVSRIVAVALACSVAACAQTASTTGGGGAAAPAAVGGSGAAPAAAGGEAAATDAGPPCVDPPDGLPSDVFCTGLYLNRDAAKYAGDVMPYTPGATLWSDGADKRRYLKLPPAAQIDTSNMDAWRFPVGTKAWKEFRFDGKLVETRMFWKRDDTTWASGTYIWDAGETGAALDTGRKGTILPSGYEIPTAKDCGKCHHGGSDSLLGVEAVALALPAATGATLSSLAQLGVLSHPPASTTITWPADSTGKAAAAFGFLHANCGMPCHSSRGLGEETKLVLRLRADELLPTAIPLEMTDLYRATVGQKPSTASVLQKFPGENRVTPGMHEQSLIWELAQRRGDYQMPPLVSHVVDAAGTQQLADWIDALAP